MVSRRNFLITSAGMGAVVLASTIRKATSQQIQTGIACHQVSVQLPKFTDALAVPYATVPLDTQLTIERKLHQFHSTLSPAPTLAYNYMNNNVGTILGPTIETPRGTPLDLTFHNNIQGSHPLAASIESDVYHYNNNQEAATLWYHDHAIGLTANNVIAGLVGMYLIRDADDPVGGNGPLGIPAGKPYEIPLVLQDRDAGISAISSSTKTTLT